MITIIYDEKEKNMILQASGHAGYAEKGSDIVCAAVSALMQTLAYSVDGGTVTRSQDDCNTLTVQAEQSFDNMAKFELVTDGLMLLAKQYPENVRFVNLHANDTDNVDLQLFADGAASGGEGGAEGEAAPAVQAPALRPAQERMARRSRPGSTTKANPQSPKPGEETFSPLPSADGDASRNSPEEEARNQGSTDERQSEGEKQNQSEEKKELTAAEKRRAFGKLMQGEYAAEFEEALQRASQATVQSIQNSPQVKALMDALGEAYGVDTASPDSLAALTEAVKNGRVKNDEYYETLAQEKGVSVKTAREMDRMEGELQRAAAEKQRAEQLRQAAEHQQRAAAVRAQWEAEAQKLQQKYPTFELDEVMNNPAVKDMILRGVGLEAAYRAAYFDQLMENQTALTAKQVEQGVEARIRQRGQRPAENGTHPGGAAETKVDVAHMTKAQRLELAKRARHGERIVL
jgi:uncharacterized protein YsxB (DUF464 family)|nr:MAG TPA: YsxB-like protein [Caudoviricetes sp.]